MHCLRTAGNLKEESLNIVARELGVSQSTIRSWVDDFHNHGKIGPLRKRRKKREHRLQAVHLDHAEMLLYHNPSLYYKELAADIMHSFAVQYSPSQQLCDGLHHRGITRKVIIFI